MSETTPIKVTEMEPLDTADDADLLMIVDISTSTSKKITVENIRTSIVGDIETALDELNGEEI